MNQNPIIKNKRILVVDDNRAIHEDFRKVLSPKQNGAAKLGAVEESLFGDPVNEAESILCFQLDSAFQGREGLELVEQAVKRREPYAMAFVDVRMPPGWDGIETCAKIWDVDPDLQVVICTAYSDYSWDDMRRKLGQSDRLVILKKPFDHIEVAQLASSLTQKWELLQESKRKVVNLEEVVEARTRQMFVEQERFKSIFENSPEGIFQTTQDGHYLCVNRALAAIYGYASPAELMEKLAGGATQIYVENGRRAEWQQRMEAEQVVREFESEIHCGDNSTKWISETACRITAPDGSLLYYQGFVLDITPQKTARREHQLMEVHLRQAQKLESVGQLAAGIAHEINTPIQYVGDNMRFVQESFVGLNRLLQDYHALAEATRGNVSTTEALAKVDSSSQEADLDYLGREIPLALKQSLDGVTAVANIVRAMKDFSHPGSVEKSPTDLNQALQTTIIVARNEWKYAADLETDLAPDLPLVPCLPGEFNQVILNLIVNAAHAIGDVIKQQPGTKGIIRLTTKRDGAWAEIRVSDTGGGIPEAVRPRIFEPFFTTKEVGKGTGQGLAIARSTIVKKHGGTLTFESTMGQGTTFIIRLPIPTAPTSA
jgi:two-component system NtrC family sensor kinase